ncbi:hypothetical protein CEXT_632741 [Caerostris extrusa]|uniref:Uncharacterized protein n=1 Tax=Caerostris extrusa TaxID=172846 RepID=A0AAV4MH55_CAEEX|nr:hypothetical protein CEXT_632741 [Caerostris extrusa]
MVCWGLYTLLDCNCNLKVFRCCSISPVRFAPEEVLQDQRGNSGEFSVLGFGSGYARSRPSGKNRLMNGRIGMRPPNSFVWELAGEKKSRETARGRKFGRKEYPIVNDSPHFTVRFGPEEVLQDQRGNSGEFSVLGFGSGSPFSSQWEKSSDEWENRNAAL